jgi:hypothetical protein
VRGPTAVTAGGRGHLEMLMTLGAAGELCEHLRNSRVSAGCSTDLPGNQIGRPRSGRAMNCGTGPSGHGPRGQSVLGASSTHGSTQASTGYRPNLATHSTRRQLARDLLRRSLVGSIRQGVLLAQFTGPGAPGLEAKLPGWTHFYSSWCHVFAFSTWVRITEKLKPVSSAKYWVYATKEFLLVSEDDML